MSQGSFFSTATIQQLVKQDTLRVLRPVLLGGLANGLLFFAVDRSQPWSLVTAMLGMGMLGTVLTRQLVSIFSLERQVSTRTDQLRIFSEVVSSLNSASNVGQTLGQTLESVLGALDAGASALWLPTADGSGELVLVEQRGFPDPDRHGDVLAQIERASGWGEGRLLRHTTEVPGRPGAPAVSLTAKLGKAGENLGYLTLSRWEGEFSEIDGAMVAAVASDIGNSLRNVRMVSEARRLADRDPVTGLLNHRNAYQRLHTELQQHAAQSRPLAVLKLDLDNFKLFNDTYGHSAGDEVLKRVAAVLKRACRDSDVAARYGGDEFLVILPETDLKQAVKCAERIQAALNKERFRCEDSATLPIGFSCGVAAYPGDSQDALELVSIADANLVQSRAEGGSQITSSLGATGASKDNSLMYIKGSELFRAMVSAIDNKDGYTRKHSEEVTEYSLVIARAMNLSEDMLRTIQLAGILHDVGKIGVPDSILRKPGKLTDEEFEEMKQHPVFGALIVGALPGMEHVVLGVRHHHERYDGRGYPDALAGENIPLIGRIMAVADAFSAMTTTRPYRKGLSERQALAEIQRGLGTQFDPQIGALFINLRENRYEELPPAAPKRRTTRSAKAAAEVAEPALR